MFLFVRCVCFHTWIVDFDGRRRPIYSPPRLFLSGYYRLALAQVEQKDYEGALRSIQEGLKRQPDSTDLQRLVRTVKVGG